MKKEIKNYLKKIGSVGGKKSKRKLTSQEAREMVQKKLDKKKGGG